MYMPMIKLSFSNNDVIPFSCLIFKFLLLIKSFNTIFGSFLPNLW